MPTVQSSASPERTSQVIHSLHTILRPFLLRRLKVDVETGLPPKKEYILYCPLSSKQRTVYDVIVQGTLRAFLLKEGGVKVEEPKEVIEISSDEDEGGVTVRTTRGKARAKKQTGKEKDAKALRFDLLNGDDDEYFRRLEAGDMSVQGRKMMPKTAEELGREWQARAQSKDVADYPPQ